MPGRTVPTVEIAAENWPSQAETVRFNVWIAQEDIAPTAVHEFDQRLRTINKSGKPQFEAAELAGLSVQVQKLNNHIDVMLACPHSNIASRDWIARLTGVQLGSVRRRLADAQNASFHSFQIHEPEQLHSPRLAQGTTYTSKLGLSQEQKTILEITAVAEIKSRSLHNVRPIEFQLSYNTAELPLTPNVR